MSTSNIRRQQLIKTAMMKGEGEVADVALRLWQPLTAHLISIIGSGGFDALYARSFYLTHAVYPWMAPNNASHSPNSPLMDLQNSLERQNADEAHKASFMLFLTFTDTLASLIGEPLTTSILTSAWSDNVPERDIPIKEFPHE
ncbi:MAG: hypothetical protein V4568_10350 [Pseudomonadota bacterium]